MVTIKSKHEIELMKKAGRITFDTLELIRQNVRPGITTHELDKMAERFIRSKGAVPSFKNYGGFPGTICASVNETIIHGFPSGYKLKEGDILSVDTGACYKGYHGDAARTFPVGKVSPEAQRLIDVTRECFFEGIKFAREGYRISDISRAIQNHAESNGYSVLREYCGHGVGHNLHEEPEIPNYVGSSRGVRIMRGMTLAIEPMVNMGSKEIETLDDGWTVITKDGKLAAHYENSVLITAGEPFLLTNYED